MKTRPFFPKKLIGSTCSIAIIAVFSACGGGGGGGDSSATPQTPSNQVSIEGRINIPNQAAAALGLRTSRDADTTPAANVQFSIMDLGQLQPGGNQSPFDLVPIANGMTDANGNYSVMVSRTTSAAVVTEDPVRIGTAVDGSNDVTKDADSATTLAVIATGIGVNDGRIVTGNINNTVTDLEAQAEVTLDTSAVDFTNNDSTNAAAGQIVDTVVGPIMVAPEPTSAPNGMGSFLCNSGTYTLAPELTVIMPVCELSSLQVTGNADGTVTINGIPGSSGPVVFSQIDNGLPDEEGQSYIVDGVSVFGISNASCGLACIPSLPTALGFSCQVDNNEAFCGAALTQ